MKRICLAIVAGAALCTTVAGTALSKPFKEMFPGVSIKDPEAAKLIEGFDFQ